MGMLAQTKSKEAKAMAANASKDSKRKAAKKKNKEPISRLCLFNKDNYNKFLSDAPKYKLITTSVLAERLSINGSLARRAIQELMRQNLICKVFQHHRLGVYIPSKRSS